MSANRPGVRIIPIHGRSPKIHDSAFVAPGCVLIGEVEIGADSSVWYNCVLRADVSRIVIGQRTNVQDGSVLHCDPERPGDPEGSPLIIGDDALIGHMAMVHGCTIEDRGFVGLGAIAMNKAVIGTDAMLAAGAMLTEGKVMAARELWGGRPARKMRDLDDAAIAGMRAGVAHYVENGKAHAAALDGAPEG
ncbi:gamma carbonic anhydrase family protein [Pelagerythrobacter aerophilus]|uniref:Gamma carbonic anhydrase family protein n=1 Tax=Pelagerythrobacter aerophilus TaxID=2306995 RepID=A0A418NE34_9SPHN|nr:gamma carbonic anhydrase family protein [Pelagerythrobacter aerophilus]RIV76008.1 gamma carbonic anhydrase family protein [Pelagerythrobacter aerophilus]RIV80737.1 gamma carbonic anhydrase family protein [Pelagerythrobacter aerophilus]